MNAANENGTYGDGIWKCNIRGQKYNKCHDGQIINHVNAKHGEYKINTNKNGIKRGMRIKKGRRNNRNGN